jgi:hypothetical protein
MKIEMASQFFIKIQIITFHENLSKFFHVDRLIDGQAEQP